MGKNNGLLKKATLAEAADLSAGFALLFLLGGPHWFFIAIIAVFAMEANIGGVDFGAKKIRI